MKIIVFMKKYILKHRAEISIFMLLSLALWVLSMFSPYTVGSYIDSLVTSPDESVIGRAVITLGIIWTLQLILTYVKNVINAKLNSQVSFDVNFNLIEHLKLLPVQYFDNNDSAYLNQRLSSDSGNITGFVLNGVAGAFIAVLSFLFSFYMIFSLNFNIALMISCLLPFYILIYFKFKKPFYDLGFKLSEESNRFHSRINKQLANIKLIKRNAWGEQLGDELKAAYSSLFLTVIKNVKLSYMFNNSDTLIRYIANMIVFIYSGYQIIEGKMSIGDFTMINTYSLIVISNISTFLSFGKSFRGSMVAYDRIQEIYGIKQEESGDISIDTVDEIQVNNLNFYHSNRHIIKDLNLRMRKGKIYAVTGKNGSGKSTFLDILTGMTQNYTGEIYYNSINLRDINIRQFRSKCLAMVEQEPILYFETLRKNISLNDNDGQDISCWIKKLDIEDFIESLPGKINYVISEKTSNLSGGEKQRIAELRAFVKDTDLVIFDEPNSALDIKNIHILCEILTNIKKDKIIIVVTHDQMLADISDEIISFSNTIKNLPAPTI